MKTNRDLMQKEKLFTVLLSPHVSEKATTASDKYRQFVFKVALDANKISIKQSVEMLFEVKVEHVRIVNMKPKKKRFGAMTGERKKWKKAYVTLQEGHDINFAGNQ